MRLQWLTPLNLLSLTFLRFMSLLFWSFASVLQLVKCNAFIWKYCNAKYDAFMLDGHEWQMYPTCKLKQSQKLRNLQYHAYKWLVLQTVSVVWSCHSLFSLWYCRPLMLSDPSVLAFLAWTLNWKHVKLRLHVSGNNVLNHWFFDQNAKLNGYQLI